ncbi:MAG TPA: metallophosphoesterase [Planctomycetota bacterium]|nr:metallophosphoesterase [Planctomycetota bacterium]
MRAAWITDAHLDFVSIGRGRTFLNEIRAAQPDALLVGGDTGQAPIVRSCLEVIAQFLQCPVYFVLGNHDYYRGSIVELREAMKTHGPGGRLCWLGACTSIPLSHETGLVGHGSWGDGRFGDFQNSPVQMNDFLLIRELGGLKAPDLLRKLQDLGDEAARHFETVLPAALDEYRHVVVLTHVAPFLEAAWYDGRPSDDDYAPFFACKATGEVLRSAMERHPDRTMTVLCGHTHGSGVVRILPNLIVYTGGAEYGRPEVQRVFEWP